MCRSEPHTPVASIRTIASPGSEISGSGTSCTSTSPGAWNVTARIETGPYSSGCCESLDLAAGPPELEALGVVDAVVAQQPHRRLVADVLGDRLLAHAAGYADERLHDELVLARGGQGADEVAIDLQIAEREVLEVVEGAEAGAKVVERDGAAERVHSFAEGDRLSHVGDCGRLRHLDDQAVRVDPVAGELVLDMGEHPAIGDREGRQIYCDPRVAGRPGPPGPNPLGPNPVDCVPVPVPVPSIGGELASHQRGDLADDHPVDLLDEAVALGGRQEAARRGKAPVGVVCEPDE